MPDISFIGQLLMKQVAHKIVHHEHFLLRREMLDLKNRIHLCQGIDMAS